MKHQVFISYKKTTDSGEDTRDALLAQNIHQVFTSRGITSFLAEESIERMGETNYMDAIDRILDAVDILVVVGSSEANLNSKWVAYEWRSFVNDILSGRKPKGRIFSYLSGIGVNELPRPLRLHQSLCHGDGQIDRLFQAVASALGISELDRFTKQGELAVDRFYEMIAVMAESRRLEMEIFSGGIGQLVMTDEQNKEMLRQIDRLNRLTEGRPGKGEQDAVPNEK